MPVLTTLYLQGNQLPQSLCEVIALSTFVDRLPQLRHVNFQNLDGTEANPMCSAPNYPQVLLQLIGHRLQRLDDRVLQGAATHDSLSHRLDQLPDSRTHEQIAQVLKQMTEPWFTPAQLSLDPPATANTPSSLPPDEQSSEAFSTLLDEFQAVIRQSDETLLALEAKHQWPHFDGLTPP